ncbi:MAG TPA: hypothetical protein P5081_17905 [Phycisphaerae bacterium]|nr:hypothetical protein [Phycisphaerae bacterium]
MLSEFEGVNMWLNADVEEFIQILIQQVRDASIESNDARLRPQYRGPTSIRWKESLANGSPESLLRTVIPDIVDETIGTLLWAIDEGSLKLSYTASSGRLVDLNASGLGELVGWYMGKPNFRERFAKQRFWDNFPDVAAD